MDQLDAGDDIRVALVVAPAGYGKSTLLAQWAERVYASGPVAWVNLEPGDNDPLVLWSRVVIALKKVCPDLDLTMSMGSAGRWSLLDLALVRLVNFLGTQGPLVMVLDDFHRITRRGVRESLAWFVENVPGNVRLALGSRTEPQLRISSMRVRGEVAEVRSDQLSFTPTEADWLLNQRFGLGLDPKDVGTLVTRTEGWPAGLQLAAMSMATTPDRHRFVTDFGASHRRVQDYLVEEVLDSYSEELRSLMVRISILERVCGPVVDAVLDQSGSGRHLDELARTNLFLIPLDEDGIWYRFHHLFGQLLRVELDRSDPGLAEQLHRRASSWFQGAGQPAEAISHILQARDFEAACELIEGNWVAFAMLGRYATVQGWIDSLPPGRVQADARLLLIQKWLLDLGGRHAEADAIESEMRRSGVPALGPQRDGFASLESGQAMRRALFTRGDVSAQVADGRRVLELEDDDGTFVALAWFTVGLGSLLLGDVAEADRSLTRAGELALGSGQWIVLGSAWAYRALMAPAGSDQIVDLATRAVTRHHRARPSGHGRRGRLWRWRAQQPPRRQPSRCSRWFGTGSQGSGSGANPPSLPMACCGRPGSARHSGTSLWPASTRPRQVRSLRGSPTREPCLGDWPSWGCLDPIHQPRRPIC